MALHTLDGEFAAQGAATTIFHHVADGVHGSRFTHDTPIEFFAARLEQLKHFGGAINRGAFFIAGEQKRNREMWIFFMAQKFFCGHQHGCQRSFHVTGTASKQFSVAVARRKGWGGPLIKRTGRNHIGVACKHQGRRVERATALDRPHIAHKKVGGSKIQMLGFKLECFESIAQNAQATCVIGGD